MTGTTVDNALGESAFSRVGSFSPTAKEILRQRVELKTFISSARISSLQLPAAATWSMPMAAER